MFVEFSDNLNYRKHKSQGVQNYVLGYFTTIKIDPSVFLDLLNLALAGFLLFSSLIYFCSSALFNVSSFVRVFLMITMLGAESDTHVKLLQ